jgi:hypothetical protein
VLGSCGKCQWQSLGLVEPLLVLQAEVELADQLVEQVPVGSGVAATLVSSTPVLITLGLAVCGGCGGPDPAGRGATRVPDARHASCAAISKQVVAALYNFASPSSTTLPP